MHMFYHLPKDFYQLAKRTPRELSPIAKSRMQTIITWQALREAGYSADKASKKLGVARSTVYRWQKRLRERNLRGLEDDSHRPKRLRTVSWSPELIETVLELREMYPRWGKEKIWVLLGREGCQTSISTVGRILCYLRKRGLLHDPPKTAYICVKRAKKRPYALRKPNNYTCHIYFNPSNDCRC